VSPHVTLVLAVAGPLLCIALCASFLRVNEILSKAFVPFGVSAGIAVFLLQLIEAAMPTGPADYWSFGSVIGNAVSAGVIEQVGILTVAAGALSCKRYSRLFNQGRTYGAVIVLIIVAIVMGQRFSSRRLVTSASMHVDTPADQTRYQPQPSASGSSGRLIAEDRLSWPCLV
jgi:uncharacterized membrane protein YwzB